MLYRPWKTYEHQDAGYFAVFVLGYTFEDAVRMVNQADQPTLAGMADIGRWHRSEAHRLLNKLIDKMERERRLLPVPKSAAMSTTPGERE